MFWLKIRSVFGSRFLVLKIWNDQPSDQPSDQPNGQPNDQLNGQLNGQLNDQLNDQLSDQIFHEKCKYTRLLQKVFIFSTCLLVYFKRNVFDNNISFLFCKNKKKRWNKSNNPNK